MYMVPNETYGKLPPFSKFKDSPSLVQRLKVERIFEGHEGCVNTIIWDESGRYLLSGSDDHSVAITDVFGEDHHASGNQSDSSPPDILCKTQTFRVKLNKASNILIAKFLPFSNNSKIVCGGKNGRIHYVETGQHPDYYLQLEPGDCHSGSVYDILTFPHAPSCCLSCSQDRTVGWFDSRERVKPFRHHLIRLHSPATALASHPHREHEFALGSADGFVRIYDLRTLGTKGIGPEEAGSGPFCGVCRPVGLPARSRPQGALMTDYGCLHITSIEFSPSGRYLVTSHMYDNVYVYDLAELEVDQDADHLRDLSVWDNRGRVGLRFGWSDTALTDSPEPVALNAFNSRWSRLRQSDRELANSKAFKIMSDEFVESELNSASRFRNIHSFGGHRNFRTVIKDACFWGDKYIMSGSECGNIFIWERSSGRIVHMLEGDSKVVNRIKPHPTLPYFASSGIDYNIKLFGPLNSETSHDQDKIDKIVTENSKFTNIAKSTACLPFWLLIGIQRSLRAGEPSAPPAPTPPDQNDSQSSDQ